MCNGKLLQWHLLHDDLERQIHPLNADDQMIPTMGRCPHCDAGVARLASVRMAAIPVLCLLSIGVDSINGEA